LLFWRKRGIYQVKVFTLSSGSFVCEIEGPAMKTILKGLWRQDSGDDVAEYALLVAMIALVVLVAVYSFGMSNGKRIGDTATSLSNSVSGGGAGSSSSGQGGGSGQGGAGGQSGGGGQGGSGSGTSGGSGGSGGQGGGVPTAPVPVN
jgi:Flp pilus assembly pilin Flp